MKPQPAPRSWVSTLISGTEILVSGFLSNIRVIKSFKKSVTSGLCKEEGRDEMGKGMGAALFFTQCQLLWAFWAEGLDSSPNREAALCSCTPLLAKPPEKAKYSLYMAMCSVIPHVQGRERPTQSLSFAKPQQSSASPTQAVLEKQL